MSKKIDKQANKLATLKAEAMTERRLRVEAEAKLAAQEEARAATAPPPPAAPAPPPEDPALVQYRALKASSDPRDQVRAGFFLTEHPHLLDLADKRDGRTRR